MKLYLIYIFVFTFCKFKLNAGKEISRCDFEGSFCKWKKDGESWFFETALRSQKLNAEINTPKVPFRQNGSYVRFTTNKLSDSNPGTLTSEYYKEKSICFTFNYYLFASELRGIELYTQTLLDNKETLIWQQTNSISDKWRKTRLSVQINGSSTLFKFKVNSKFVAFDEFIVENGNCSYDGLCDFESDTCTWTLDNDDGKKSVWKRAKSDGRFSWYDLPKTDHTTGTENGHFLYTTEGNKEEMAVTIKSPVHDQSFGVHCLSFWFYLPEKYRDVMRVWLEDATTTNKREEIWVSNKENSIERQWQLVQRSIGTTKPSRIVFEEFKQKDYGGTAAVDDISMTVGMCQAIGSCDFNDDACGFTFGAKDVTLRHGFGRVSVVNTMPKKYLPPFDPSNLNGMYVYSDFSNIETKTLNTLSSEVLPPKKQACLRFSYFINGVEVKNNSQLNVKILQITTNKLLTIFNNKTYSEDWRNKTLDISGQDMAFRVIFEMVGWERGSILAIDDIKYAEGNCEAEKPTNKSTEIKELGCNFENGLCSWKSTLSSQKSLPIWKTEVPSDVSGEFPSFDMTTQSKFGKYAYLYSTGYRALHATLTSSRTTGDGWRCLSFWYWTKVNVWSVRLKVALLNSNEEQEQVLLDRETRDSGGWQLITSSYYSDREHEIALFVSGYNFLAAIDEIKIFKDSCPVTTTDYLSCNFESGECGFIPQDNKDVIWKRLSTKSTSNYVSYDASFDYSGHLFAVDVRGYSSLTGKTQLISPAVHPSDVLCISYAYFLSSPGLNLNVYFIESGIEQLNLIDKISKSNQNWKRSFNEITVSSKFNLIFEATCTNVSKGLIGVDNVKISHGYCNGFMKCDFEENCFWTLVDTGLEFENSVVNTEWVRSKGSDLSPKITDHTMNRQQANVMAMIVYRGRKRSSRDYIAGYKSIQFGFKDNQTSACLQFAHFFGGDHEIRVFYEEEGKNLKKLFSVKPTSLNEWKLVQIDFEAKSTFYLYLVGRMQSKSKTFIAIDDISVSYSQCPKLEKTFQCKSGEKISAAKVCDFNFDCGSKDDEENCGNCNFNDNFCGYKTNGFKLINEQFAENFMAEMETKDTKTATIQSNTLRNASQTCRVELRYRSAIGKGYTAHLGADLNINGENTNIWGTRLSPKSNNGNKWITTAFAIGAIEKFKVTFKVIVDSSWFTSGSVIVAIDDINFKDCAYPAPTSHCGDHQFKCNNRVCVEKTLDVCDYENDCGDNSDESNCGDYKAKCDFENGVCDKWANHGWDRQNGDYYYVNGITRDHTLGLTSGYFLSYTNPKVSASLEYTNTIYPSDDCYFRFFYDSYSSEALIHVNIIYENKTEKTVSTFKQHNERIFKKANVYLGDASLGDSFKLKLVPEIKQSLQDSHIAIDDLSFTPQCFPDETIDIVTTEPTTKPDCDFTCDTNRCLNLSQVCNFVKDCSDGTDEQDCGECKFETSLCKWTNEGEEEWLQVDAQRFKEYKIIPSEDATGNKLGSFIILQSNSERKTEKSAILRSPTLRNSKSSCKIQFSYFNNFKNGSLKVQKNVNGTITELFTAPSTESNNEKWSTTTASLASISGEFNIEFVATGEYHRWIEDIVPIGVDEFKFLSCEPIGNEEILNCPFDNSKYCEWNTANGTWTFSNSRKRKIIIDGPRVPDGKNSFLKLNDLSDTNKGSTLMSRRFESTSNSFCFTFNYFVFASKFKDYAIELLSVRNEKESVIWRTRNSLSDKWQKARLTLNTNKETWQLKFRVYSSLVAFSDFSTNDGNCSYDGMCDFESDTCSWVAERNASLFWKRGTNADHKNYLPEYDHTTLTKDGHFIYTVSDYDRASGISILRSPLHDSSFGVQCLRFWYYKPDNGRDLLNVRMYGPNISEPHLLWTSTTQENHAINNWQLAQLSFGATKSFQISIESFRNEPGTHAPAISIDDISIEPGECHSIASCDFNENTCGFVIDPSNTTLRHGFGRVENVASMPTSYKLPRDPSVKNGFYIYSDFSNIDKQTANILTSEVLPAAKEGCLRFSYFIAANQDNSPTLIVNATSIESNSIPLTLFSKSKNSDDWQLISHDVVGQEKPFRVYFEMIANQKGSIIAIDDINYTNMKCDDKTPPNEPVLIKDLSVDFESGFNDYTQPSWTILPWIIDHSRSTKETVYRYPPYDVTRKTREGNFALFLVPESRYNRFGAQFTSKRVTERGWRCVSFWYWFDSSAKESQLRVGLVDVSLKRTLFNIVDKNTRGWQQVRRTYNSDIDHNIAFYATCTDCLIAVDDIKVYNGSCPDEPITYSTCDFEDGQCGFVPIDNKDIVWKRYVARNGGVKFIKDGSGNNLGHYMAVNFDTGRALTGAAQLESPALNITDTVCVSFSHYFDANNAKLNVYAETAEVMDLISSLKQNSDLLSWQTSYFQVPISYEKWFLKFVAVFNKTDSGLIAVDNVYVNSGPCRNYYSCDFEQSCLWRNLNGEIKLVSSAERTSLSSNANWQRLLGRSLSKQIEDHTTGKQLGTVLALRTTGGWFSHQYVGILKSVPFKLPSSQKSACLTIAHYFRENQQIRVYVGSNDENVILMSTIQGDQQNKWRVTQVDLKPNDSDFFVYIAAITNTNRKVFTAIDDISVTLSECKVVQEKYKCKSGEELPISKVCDFKFDCLSKDDEKNCGNCTFESSFCGYQNNGFRLEETLEKNFIQVSSKYPFKSSIESPILRNSRGTCMLTFQYKSAISMSSSDATFSVQLEVDSQNEPIDIWSSELVDSRKNEWNNALVTVGAVKKFNARITAKYSAGFSDDFAKMALDHVFFHNCSFPSPSSDCSADQFRCKSGLCIDKKNVCDFENDCGDNSDEKNCDKFLNRCAFESNDCYDLTESKGWTVRSGFTSIYKGLMRDHTIGLPSGKFLQCSGGQKKCLFIYSKDLKIKKNCYLRFYYAIYAKKANLNVIIAYDGNDKVLQTLQNSEILGFQRAIVDLGNIDTNSNIELRFEGEIVNTAKRGTSYIAMDDISFAQECFVDETIVTTPETPPEPLCRYYCASDKKCLNETQICDFNKDCDDGSDEVNCGECDFENSFCGWKNEGNEQWLSAKGERFNEYKLFPTVDNKGSNKSSFLILQSNTAPINGEVAVLRSRTIGKVSALCHLQFAYFNNFKKGSLKIQLRGENTTTIVFSAPFTNSTVWRQQMLPINPSYSRFNIEFVASGEYHEWIDQIVPIGIDDFKLFNCTPTIVEKERPLDCDFEKDECGWYQLRMNFQRLPWIRTNDSAEIHLGYNTSSDHTKNSGYFVYVHKPEDSNATRAVYMSPIQKQTKKSCFHFWYRIFSRIPVSLELRVNPLKGGFHRVLLKRNSQSNSWQEDWVNIESDQDYRLMFIANIDAYSDREKFNKFLIALDDMSMIDGACNRKDDCDFEVSSCDWSSKDWQRVKGESVNPPVIDHTTGTTSGNFMFSNKDSKLVLNLKNSAKPSVQCLSFWFLMKGGTEDVLSVTQKNVALWKETAVDEILEGSEVKTIDDGWIYGRVNITSNSDETVTFNAQVKSKNAFILLDDVVLSETPCQPIGSCDFEKDFCGWKNINKNGINGNVWLRNSGKTPSPYTGPTVDHTKKSDEGFYLFVENHGIANEAAVIESELLRLIPRVCVEFYYFMYSTDTIADIGSLNTAYFNEETGITIDVGSPITGVQSKEWLLYRQTFNELPDKYKIVITAKTGNATTGDIAIDDILVRKGACEGEPEERCSSEEFDCKTEEKICLPKLYVCDFTEDCPNGLDEKTNCTTSCDFENGDQCGWNGVDPTIRPFWQISKAGNVVDTILPNTDHTSNSKNGWYAHVFIKPSNNGTAKLESNLFSRTGAECVLDFYYFCRINNCNLKLFKLYQNGTRKMLWDTFDDTFFDFKVSKWRIGKAYIGKDQNFKLSFQVKDSRGRLSSVAIDDLMFRNCSVPRFDDVDNCDKVKDFQCSNGHCIDKQRECDFTNDCMDNSDEAPTNADCKSRVGNCDFESNCTHWRATNFFATTGKNQSTYTPATDHTTRTDAGTYLSVNRLLFDFFFKINGRLTSNVISSKSNECVMRFWYNLIGSPNMNTISVYKRYENSYDSMLLIKNLSVEDTHDFWWRTEIDLLKSGKNENFEIVIETNLKSQGSANVDDISFSPGCVMYESNVKLPDPVSPPPPTPMITTTTETPTTLGFQCPRHLIPCKSVKKCYNWRQQCDFIDDCGDNTDEDDCGIKCDFESKCHWFNGGGFMSPKWDVHSGASIHRSLNTGPMTDNTLKTEAGHYLVTNQTKPSTSKQFEKSVYRTIYYPKAGKRCQIHFYYHMYGTKSASLKLMLSASRKKTEVWSVSGDKGDEWIPAKIAIGNQSQPFYLAFETSVIGKGEIVDIALDDIELSDCAPEGVNCRADELLCSDNSSCYKIWERCNGVYECKDRSDELNCKPTTGNCDFNDPNWLDSCKWRHLESDFEWSTARVSDKKTTGPQKPLADSDMLPSNTGTFMAPALTQVLYLNSTGHEVGDAAAITTPEFAPSDDVCHLTYHYYMYGSPKLGPLRIFTQGTKSGNRTLLAQYHGNNGQRWISAQHVIETTEPYSVIFEGLVGEPGLSDIAVDEVRFSENCKEGTIPVVTSPPCLGFLCKSGDCIPDKSVQCDRKQDCEDGSDEVGCDYPESMCDRKGHFECSPNDCIPGLLVCDGYKDCKNGEDERECPVICDDQHYYCPKGDAKCRLLTETCDGEDQCETSYDESLCNVKECPDNYCVNGEMCLTTAGVPICSGCPQDSNSRRCVRSNKTLTTPKFGFTTLAPTTPSLIPISTKSPISDSVQERDNRGNYAAIVLGVLAAVIVIAVIAVFAYRRYRSGTLNFPPMTFSNPVYDVALSDLNTEDAETTASTTRTVSSEDINDDPISVPASSWRRYH